MAFFIAAGSISNDIVRKETRNGVLATFRLETGAPRNGKLWIDIETWGHLAGTIAHYASKDRGVTVSGRLIQKTWRDKTTGESRNRYVVTANEIDFHPNSFVPWSSPPTNSVLTSGRVGSLLPSKPAGTGSLSCFRLAAGKANTKAGRLQIEVRQCRQVEEPVTGLERGASVVVVGALAYSANSGRAMRTSHSSYYLSAREVGLAGKTRISPASPTDRRSADPSV